MKFKKGTMNHVFACYKYKWEILDRHKYIKKY
jgi:hypothetical protein